MKKEFIKGQKAWSSIDGEVEILDIVEGGYCVRTYCTAYTACGREHMDYKYPALFHSKADMIEYFSNLEEKKTYTAWVNLYPSGNASAHETKAYADSFSNSDRVECREISWVVEL